ncbi:hypothetical protein K8Z61_11525 [Nocardioides sp. TRM66260-LWL]|uniref:hypothetical protein n=1 Tax=Nocardioides sp. TRM66260-LWL TaxID=2874478 RepID=UPI001CC55F0E|nr:hypothetical protein [Nocardioides sp. TRM66260-LWL]MBZ5735127.1 hypothetical protein [Nocardioides sp. TRM66260-LWL]
MDAVIYYLPASVGCDGLVEEIKEKASRFLALFPEAGSLAEELLRGVSATLDDLIDDSLGGSS